MIAPSIGEFAKAATAARKMLDVIEREPAIDSLGSTGKTPKNINGEISLQNVCFAYPARPSLRVLEGVNLEFEAGKVTALVGASGSGKSTIVGLMERWYDPQDGHLFLDGHDIKDLNVKWLRSQIGYVQQVCAARLSSCR
jgi:ATP-binding cassette subfamily B (MDR/TAP) protein 1